MGNEQDRNSEDIAALARKVGKQFKCAQELSAFADSWDEKYPTISHRWQRHWPKPITLFDYPDDIRAVIYTTNPIELLNRVIRKAIKNLKVPPHEMQAIKGKTSHHLLRDFRALRKQFWGRHLWWLED